MRCIVEASQRRRWPPRRDPQGQPSTPVRGVDRLARWHHIALRRSPGGRARTAGADRAGIQLHAL